MGFFSTVQPPKNYMFVYAVINAVFAMLETTPMQVKFVCMRSSVMSCIKENIVTNAARYFFGISKSLLELFYVHCKEKLIFS